MALPWLDAAGRVIVDEDGHPILCDDCPCDADPITCENFEARLGGSEAEVDLSDFPFGTSPATCDCASLDTFYNLPIVELLSNRATYQQFFPIDCTVFPHAGATLEVVVVLECFEDSLTLSTRFTARRGSGDAQWEGGGFQTFAPGTFNFGQFYDLSCGVGSQPGSTCRPTDGITVTVPVRVYS